MAILPPKQLLREAREQGLDRQIPAIAVEATLIEGYDASDERTLLEPSMLLTPVPHPVLAALLTLSDATRTGRMTWQVGMGRETFNPAPLVAVRDHLMRGTLYMERTAAPARGRAKVLTDIAAHISANPITNHFAGTVAGTVMAAANINAVANAVHPATGAGHYGAVTLSGDHRATFIKVVTHNLNVPEHLPQIPLNLRPAGKPFTEPRPVRPVEAIAVLEWLASVGVTVVDPSEGNDVAVLRRRLASAVVAYPTPGRPALAQAAVGRKVYAAAAAVLGNSMPFPAPAQGEATTRGTMTAHAVMDLVRQLPQVDTAVHLGTADAGALALAKPVDDERLRPYQREAVGLHVTTEVGYLQCSAPGLGKTIMAFGGMERRAARIDAYRGLVVAEANVRKQWTDEAKDWFPGARMVRLESRSDAPVLAAAMADTSTPLVAVISYGLLPAVKAEMERREALAEQGKDDMRVPAVDPGSETSGDHEDMLPGVDESLDAPPVLVTEVGGAFFVDVPLSKSAEAMGQMDLFSLFEQEQPPAPVLALVPDSAEQVEDGDEFADADLGSLLLDTFWHDIIADEAEVLRGTGSKQASALWQLRHNSGVALALTGTPINRGVDDLGRLMSWVRNDEHLFRGVRLSTQFDMDKDEDLEAFTAAMGPLLFRRDTSEIADELPTVVPVVMTLEPSPEEKALAGAARAELKRVYDELMSALEMAEELDPGNPDFAVAHAALAEARGAWLGGTTLARMAASDPAALLGSTSAGAALLAGQGLIEAATNKPGTKRTAVVADVTNRVANGEKVLIFTEFATVARGVIDDLDAAGVRVGEVLGGGGKKRDRMVAEFQTGQLDVLVCTSSGERGLNLQQANTIVHYDLPWTPKGVIQRTGRAMRIKSQNKTLQVVFPLMAGTIEERVAGLVVTRAVEAMRALDASRGVDTTRTEMGLALGGLVTALEGTAASRAGQGDLMELTAALVA